jgi:tRNA (cytidine/uridine-2'-O-)-methyltransferase
MPREPLRVPPLNPAFQVVLVEPEIPQNTGNVARTCAATFSPLHLVGPLGFRIDDHAVRRAGLDYWHLVDLHRHLDWAHFLHAYRADHPEGRCFFFTAQAERSWFSVRPPPRPGDALVFGRESVGLPQDLLDAHPDDLVAIPTVMRPEEATTAGTVATSKGAIRGVRSHNLGNCVAIALYEGLRGVGAL